MKCMNITGEFFVNSRMVWFGMVYHKWFAISGVHIQTKTCISSARVFIATYTKSISSRYQLTIHQEQQNIYNGNILIMVRLHDSDKWASTFEGEKLPFQKT